LGLGLGSQQGGRHVQLARRVGGRVLREQPGPRTLEDRLVGHEVGGLVEQLDADGGLALVFGAPVLVPSFHLGVAQFKLGRQLHPILNGEILLRLKARLQLLELVVREGGSGLPLFALLPVVAQNVLDEKRGSTCTSVAIAVLLLLLQRGRARGRGGVAASGVVAVAVVLLEVHLHLHLLLLLLLLLLLQTVAHRRGTALGVALSRAGQRVALS